MASQNRIVCKRCRGENDRGTRFCWYCGAPLRGGAQHSRARETAVDLFARASKWLLFLGLLAGLVIGAYYALDHYWPAGASDTTEVLTVTTSTQSTTTSSSTTLPPRSDRVVAGAADRYATAIAISKVAFPDGAPALVLVPGDDYAQGIAVAPLAAAYKAAVLLAPPDGIRDDLAQEIQRLAPSQVFLVAVPHATTVTEQLKSFLQEPTITRLAGGDEYETAALIGEQVKAKLGSMSKVVIVPSDSFVEGLAVAPLAAANGWPMLLCPSDGTVPRTTRNAITSLGATSALVIGLNADLNLDDVETQVGADSYDTAALVVGYAVTHGFSFTHIAIATGANFPDGLVTGAYLAHDRGILVLAKDGQPQGSLLAILNANLDDIRMLDFIALPELAKQMTVKRSTSSTTEGTR
jgi:putative cell wall-binding protein